MKYATASVLLLAALAFGQSWVVEQVDSTAASGSPVELAKAADGRLWTCYQTANGVVRVACLGDSGWDVSDVRSAYVPPSLWRPFLAAGSHGELCLSCYTQDSGFLYRLVEDTWHGVPYPFAGQSLIGTVAYDNAGRLHTAFDPSVGDFWAGRETDSGWTAGGVVTMQGFGSYRVSVSCFTVAADGSPWYFAYLFWYWSDRVWGEEAAMMHLAGDTWERLWGEAGQGEPIPLALVPHGDSVGYLSIGDGVIQCDSEVVASLAGNSVAGLAYSADDVPLVTWVPRFSSAKPVFASKTNRWHTEIVPGPAGIGGIDIEVGTAGQVVIVYSTQDSGLWCARGADVVGVENNPRPQVPSRKLEPTVVRRLPTGAVVFDAMGRRVVHPRSGIYFLGEGLGARGQGLGRMRKVILQR